MVSSEEK